MQESLVKMQDQEQDVFRPCRSMFEARALVSNMVHIIPNTGPKYSESYHERQNPQISKILKLKSGTRILKLGGKPMDFP